MNCSFLVNIVISYTRVVRENSLNPVSHRIVSLHCKTSRVVDKFIQKFKFYLKFSQDGNDTLTEAFLRSLYVITLIARGVLFQVVTARSNLAECADCALKEQ